MEPTPPSSHASKIRQAASGDLPLFHQPADHGGLDALARSFSQKRWPSFTEHGDIEMKTEKNFRKALLIRQMQECLERAPQAVRESPNFEAAQAALLEYTIYSNGVHPSTHKGHKNWSDMLQKHFLGLAQGSGKLCGPDQLVAAAKIDSEQADGGNYPLWNAIHAIPRQIKAAEAITTLSKDIETLQQISTIDSYHERRDAYGRWLHHIEPYNDFIDKYAERTQSLDVSLRASMEENAYRVKPMSMLTCMLGLQQVVRSAREQLFSTHPTMEHCLVAAYRDDRKGCIVQGFKPYNFTSRDARESTVMDVVYAARWGALADRIAITLQAEGINTNRPAIATKHAMPKVDKLLEFCGLPSRSPSSQLS